MVLIFVCVLFFGFFFGLWWFFFLFAWFWGFCCFNVNCHIGQNYKAIGIWSLLNTEKYYYSVAEFLPGKRGCWTYYIGSLSILWLTRSKQLCPCRSFSCWSLKIYVKASLFCFLFLVPSVIWLNLLLMGPLQTVANNADWCLKRVYFIMHWHHVNRLLFMICLNCLHAETRNS